jgi:hypothetical protein
MMNSPLSASPLVHEVCGALHLHTTFSDGGVDYPRLIAAAKEVGLDFVVVTDHMSLKGRREGYEGFSGGLFVVVGYEHNDANNINHYLALKTTEVLKDHDSPQRYIDAVKKDGGIGFLAHPVEKRHYFKDYPAYPWTAWDATGFDGIEVWNQMSDWLEHLKSWVNFFRLFYPRRFLAGIEKEMIEKWDGFNRRVFISGIGGVDAHTMKTKIGPFRLTVFPIKVELKGIRTHLYLEEPLPSNDPPRARELFFDALRLGRGFISNFRRRDARGTRLFVEYADGARAFPGPQPPGGALPARIHARLVDKAEIRLIRNGQIVRRHAGSDAAFDISEGGLYRVEVFKGKNAWIYSNPFPIGAYPLW